MELAYGKNLRITEKVGTWLLAQTRSFKIEAQLTDGEFTGVAAHYHGARVVLRVNPAQRLQRYYIKEERNYFQILKDDVVKKRHHYKRFIRLVEQSEGKSSIVRFVASDFMVHMHIHDNSRIEYMYIRTHDSTLSALQGGICKHTDSITVSKAYYTSHFAPKYSKGSVPMYILSKAK